MSKTMEIGPYSAYAIAVKYGYTGTEEQWVKEQEANRVASEQAAQRAEAATEAAKTAASEASTSAGNASTSAQQAADSLQELKDGIASGNFKGEKGDTGPQGEKGDTGPQGPKGETGPSVALDITLTHESEAADAKAAGDAISAVRTRQNILTGTETGNPIAVDDAFSAPLCGLTVYGKSTQDGTPTLDAPVPIVSAGDSGSVAVKVTEKNLLNIPDGSVTARGVTVTAKDGLISISGTATSSGYANLAIPPFIISGVVILSSSIASPRAKLVSATWGVVLSQDTADKMSDMATRIVFIIDQGQTYNITGIKVQLELGTTATAYSPYREQLLTLPTPTGLPGIPVTSDGNYTDQSGQQWICDEIDLARGVRVQRVESYTLQNVIISTIAANTYLISYANEIIEKASGTVYSLLCTTYTNDHKSQWASEKNPISWSGEPHRQLRVYDSRDQAEVLASLNSGNVRIDYVLDDPIEIPLTPAELTAYKALTTYAPNTVVQAADGAGLKLDYQRDVNIVIKNLEDAIASMT